ncbi:hypothetical protein OC844_005395, partial [Tilletia horrida]
MRASEAVRNRDRTTAVQRIEALDSIFRTHDEDVRNWSAEQIHARLEDLEAEALAAEKDGKDLDTAKVLHRSLTLLRQGAGRSRLLSALRLQGDAGDPHQRAFLTSRLHYALLRSQRESDAEKVRGVAFDLWSTMPSEHLGRIAKVITAILCEAEKPSTASDYEDRRLALFWQWVFTGTSTEKQKQIADEMDQQAKEIYLSVAAGSLKPALNLGGRAIELYKQLLKQDQNIALRSGLAHALFWQADRLVYARGKSNLDEAIKLGLESIDQRSIVIRECPTPFQRSQYAIMLHWQASRLTGRGDSGDLAKAIAYGEESIQIRDELSEGSPQIRWDLHLVDYLRQQARRLDGTGKGADNDKAITLGARCIKLCRGNESSANKIFKMHQSFGAASISAMSFTILDKSGSAVERAEAIQIGWRSIDIFSELDKESQPAQHRDRLVLTIINQAMRLARAGGSENMKETLRLSKKAVAVCKSLIAREPNEPAHQRLLRDTLLWRTTYLRSIKDDIERVTAVSIAEDIKPSDRNIEALRQELKERSTWETRILLAFALSTQGQLLVEEGSQETLIKASDRLSEANKLYEELMIAEPELDRQRLCALTMLIPLNALALHDLLDTTDLEKATEVGEKGLSLSLSLQTDHPGPQSDANLARAYCSLSELYGRTGNTERSIELGDKGIEILEGLREQTTGSLKHFLLEARLQQAKHLSETQENLNRQRAFTLAQ